LALCRPSRVLVAHSQASVRQGLTGVLRRAGYEVDEAGDFDAALAILDKGEVDILVVSSGLPPEGCRALLDACRTPPATVVLKGQLDDTTMLTADPRVRSVLTRPFPLQTLYDAVAEATRRSRDR